MAILEPIVVDPESFFKQNQSLPSLPEIVIKLKEEIDSANSNPKVIAEMVSSDPSLVAQVLRMVNSAYYSLPRAVSDVRFAIAFIGLNELYRIVLSLSVVNTIDVQDPEALKRFWFHAFFTAMSAKTLATEFEPHLDPEIIWSGAMLHNIGSLIYLKFFPDHFAMMNKICEKKGALFCNAHKPLKSPSASDLGVMLCDYWQLPKQITIACKYHGADTLMKVASREIDDPFVRMICMGSMMSSIAEGSLSEELQQKISALLMKGLGIDEQKFVMIMATIHELRGDADSFANQIG